MLPLFCGGGHFAKARNAAFEFLSVVFGTIAAKAAKGN
jgi:hypothetical protein